MDYNLSDSSSSPPADTIHVHSSNAKRTASDAGLKPNGMRPPKSVKRRASKACQCCRSRKVRCNVVEHGAPCTNCRLDEVECIVSESKRKKLVNTLSAFRNTPSNNLQEMDDQRDVTHCKEQHAQTRSERSHVRTPSIRALETVKRACATFSM
jgi:hypothetical protein